MFTEKVAKKIWEKWSVYCEKKKKTGFSKRVEKELGSLYPGSNVKKLVSEFYEKKLSLCCLIAIVGMGFLVLYIVSCKTEQIIYEEHYLEKDEADGMKKTVVLDATVGDLQLKKFEITVEKKELSEDEIKLAMEQLSEELERGILGENTSLSHVDKPLVLMETWDKVPVTIYWKSSDREVIAEDGSLNTSSLSGEGKKIVLTATMIYGEFVKEKEIFITVYPENLSEEEAVKQKITKLLKEEQEKNAANSYLELPDMLDGSRVEWKAPVGDLFPVLVLLVVVCVAAVFGGKDNELHKEYEKRNKQLLLEYPEFVSKLQLLLCSGLSVRSAFARMGKEYLKRKKEGGGVQYVCEELLLAVRKMENGMPEAEALKFFGERCNLFCYKKLVSLILHNLKRGSDGLRDSLMNESRSAFEERKQTARKLGEEAGTKLLLPMMMMMGIVLVIIVIPAYFSFGGIN